MKSFQGEMFHSYIAWRHNVWKLSHLQCHVPHKLCSIQQYKYFMCSFHKTTFLPQNYSHVQYLISRSDTDPLTLHLLHWQLLTPTRSASTTFTPDVIKRCNVLVSSVAAALYIVLFSSYSNIISSNHDYNNIQYTHTTLP